MTIITALHDGKKTWLGHNDSVTISDTVIASTLQPWVMFGEWALGITGDSAQQNLLELHTGKLTEAGSDAHALVDMIRGIFSDYGHSMNEDGEAAPSYNIWCILAHKDGSILDISSRLAITRIRSNKFWARGSGTDYALGADRVLQELQLTAEERVRRATQAAVDCDLYCPGIVQTFNF